jgi:hypothetical protein
MTKRALTATAAAVVLAAGMAAIIISPTPPAAAHPVNSADFQQVELARGWPKWVSRCRWPF